MKLKYFLILVLGTFPGLLFAITSTKVFLPTDSFMNITRAPFSINYTQSPGWIFIHKKPFLVLNLCRKIVTVNKFGENFVDACSSGYSLLINPQNATTGPLLDKIYPLTNKHQPVSAIIPENILNSMSLAVISTSEGMAVGHTWKNADIKAGSDKFYFHTTPFFIDGIKTVYDKPVNLPIPKSNGTSGLRAELVSQTNGTINIITSLAPVTDYANTPPQSDASIVVYQKKSTSKSFHLLTGKSSITHAYFSSLTMDLKQTGIYLNTTSPGYGGETASYWYQFSPSNGKITVKKTYPDTIMFASQDSQPDVLIQQKKASLSDNVRTTIQTSKGSFFQTTNAIDKDVGEEFVGSMIQGNFPALFLARSDDSMVLIDTKNKKLTVCPYQKLDTFYFNQTHQNLPDHYDQGPPLATGKTVYLPLYPETTSTDYAQKKGLAVYIVQMSRNEFDEYQKSCTS